MAERKELGSFKHGKNTVFIELITTKTGKQYFVANEKFWGDQKNRFLRCKDYKVFHHKCPTCNGDGFDPNYPEAGQPDERYKHYAIALSFKFAIENIEAIEALKEAVQAMHEHAMELKHQGDKFEKNMEDFEKDVETNDDDPF